MLAIDDDGGRLEALLGRTLARGAVERPSRTRATRELLMRRQSSLMLLMRSEEPDSGIVQVARRSVMPMACAFSVVSSGWMVTSTSEMVRLLAVVASGSPKSRSCKAISAAERSGP